MSAPATAFAAALPAIWRRHQAATCDRLRRIEQAVAALPSGPLPPDIRTAAGEAAHKLAGTLGTFGSRAGSDHARAIECILLEARDLDGRDLEPLRAHASALAAAVSEVNAAMLR